MSAIENIRRYVANRKAQPLLGLGDSVHRIHAGHELEAEITFTDLAATIAVHDELVKALQFYASEWNCNGDGDSETPGLSRTWMEAMDELVNDAGRIARDALVKARLPS